MGRIVGTTDGMSVVGAIEGRVLGGWLGEIVGILAQSKIIIMKYLIMVEKKFISSPLHSQHITIEKT